MTEPQTIREILGHFDSLMRNVAGWHAPDFLGVDVTMSQAKCLYLVAVHPGIGMSALAEHLHVGPSAVSGLVERLVEHGYLDRYEDPADRRAQLVSLTPSGVEVLDRIREFNTDLLRTLLAGMSPAELDGLRLGLAALAREAQRTFSGESLVPHTPDERTHG
jgi:DNA-binding MarR family transcriptional regulator